MTGSTGSGKAGNLMAERLKLLAELYSPESLTHADSINQDESHCTKMLKCLRGAFLQYFLIAIYQVHPQMTCGISLSAPRGDFQAGRALGFSPGRK